MTEDSLKRFACLDRTMLKLIAVISMITDHIGFVLFPAQIWMRLVGRLAMPIFSFFISEGFCHTSDRKKYLLRIGAFALISELPFDLAFFGRFELSSQNVMFTFFLAVAALLAYDFFSKKGGQLWTAAGYISVFIIAIAAFKMKTDYDMFGVILVFIFYFFREKGAFFRNSAAALFQMLVKTNIYSNYAALSFFPLMMYNGKKGAGLKWFFYIFYPGHLLILFVVSKIVRTGHLF